ncbi:HlyD family secretion protein [Ancylobacter amanitiformis]|uniref:Multidrug resistance efflux pump n=1 Tax=Ancylobacter amanitiformis TaxID=217069 RepID=A0ABU0LU10_9HYPH|nr:biotin/lipoyl-binding protein [Ancylobacter amanitiformis]MDQ0512202.1 multidrug resistance efflux pump [Ancylobacter amanitiformis]
MLELMLCSMLTVLPDYLYRRFAQGKRFGREITLYSVWYELRWGITACLMLTVSLITVIFYNHPASTNVTAYFRTVSILPETVGRVAEVYVGVSDHVEQGQPILRLDDSSERAAVEAARRRIEETDASMIVARSDIAVADGQILQAAESLQQAMDELATKQELVARNADVVTRREIERLQNVVDGRQGALAAANAAREGAVARLDSLLPAQKASAVAALAQAETELAKTVVRAGVSGRVEQFVLRVGDLVNPMIRAAGVLIPDNAGRERLIAGFGQIEAQVMKPGMVAEATCISKPFTIIPMVVTNVQNYIAAGQFRATEQLLDAQQVQQPGTITVQLEPLYEGGLDGVPPGSSCIANAYSSNHERLAAGDLGMMQTFYLHMVDTVALVHALLLRLQALIMPIQTLVFGGH